MDNDNFWSNFLNYVSSKLQNISFNTWFKNLKLLNIDETTITIKVDNNFIKTQLMNFYEDLMDEAIFNILGKNLNIELTTEDIVEKEEPVIVEKSVDLPKYKNNNSNLNPAYTFKNFVVGDSNRFAQTIALAVAEQPGKLYNPLFIYGKSGLGKTHLMHAIGNYVMDNSDKTVLYITSETFISDFTQINIKDDDRLDLVKHFKDKYRNVDVLIIDDIQFLGGASKTQGEFFNTFEFLHNLNKQIIISSDRSPDDLKVLEDRLRTRFNWGITVDITPPDYELKLNILKNKIMGHEVSTLIKDGVLEYIANNCESDGRHLEGAINRLYAYTAMYSPKEINLEFATEALKDYLGKNDYILNSIKKIQVAVADYFDITVDTLKSKKRTANINYARQIAMYLCKMTTDEKLEKIGLEFNRDHATVIHSCTKIEEEYKTNEELRLKIKEIKDKINN